MDRLSGHIVYPFFKGNENYVCFSLTSNLKIRVKTKQIKPNRYFHYELKGHCDNLSNIFIVESYTIRPMEYSTLFLKRLKEENILIKNTGNINHMILESVYDSPEIAVWYDPELYLEIASYYGQTDVFEWSYRTCLGIKKIICSDPYSLSYTSPFEDMCGISLDLEDMVQRHPISLEQRELYDSALVAKKYCTTPMLKLSSSEISQSCLILLQEKQFLEEINGWVVRSHFYDIYRNMFNMTMIRVQDHKELKTWCMENDDFVFLTHNRILMDTSIFPFSVVEDITPGSKICLLHLECWTLHDLDMVFKKIRPEDVTGIGFVSSIGNRFGYNVLHCFQDFVPTIKNPIEEVLNFQNWSESNKKVILIRVGENLFHNNILSQLQDYIKKYAHKKVSYIVDSKINYIPWSFRCAISKFRKYGEYHVKERIIHNNNRLTFVKKLTYISTRKGSKPPTKRQRLCPSTSSNIPNNKCFVRLENGIEDEFFNLRLKMKHCMVIKDTQSIVIYDDIIIYFCQEINLSKIHSLKLSCKRLFIITTERVVIPDSVVFNPIIFL